MKALLCLILVALVPQAFAVIVSSSVVISSSAPISSSSISSSSISSVPPAGTGTSIDPYQIDSLPNLYWMSQNGTKLDSNFVQTSDINASETKSWNGGAGFPPIGDGGDFFFTGTYNGKGHIIRGLNINGPTTDNVGLFGYTNAAVIDSVGLDSAVIIGRYSVGALVGLNKGTVLHSFAIHGSVSGVTDLVGGLVGYHFSGKIAECFTTGSVSSPAGTLGGLVGWNQDSLVNSYSRATVVGSSAVYAVGGLVGHNVGNYTNGVRISALIQRSYATGVVTCSNCAASAYVGGLVGKGLSAEGSVVDSSFWDIESSGISSSGSGNGKSTALMRTQSMFTDSAWDFATIWAISASVNSGYPTLRNMGYLPVVNTQNASAVTAVSALSHASLVGLGYMGVSAQGLCWSLGYSPLVSSDSCVNLGVASDTGAFSASITGLTKNTSYFVRAYAIAGADTVFGDTVRLTTTLAGSGSDADPFLVTNYEDLKAVGVGYNSLSAVYRVTANIDASSSVTENDSSGFIPIKKDTTYFTGKFHGGGHLISGLTIRRPTQGLVGLFAKLSVNGLIDSLGLENASITGNVNVGGLAGGMDTISIIRACHFTGSVRGNGYVGGLVGFSYGGIVEYSYNHSNVIGDGPYIGGLLGLYLPRGSKGRITESFATGSVTGKSAVGGLIGFVLGLYGSAEVANCYSSVQVTGDSAVGGLFGELVSLTFTVRNSYVAGSFNPTANTYGGLFGIMNLSPTVSACLWDTTVSGIGGGGDGRGRSSTQMQTKQTFADSSWNFDSTWILYEGHTYPLLRAFLTPLTITAKDTTKIYDGNVFSGGNGVSYSTTPNSLLYGTSKFSGTSQGAKNVGEYTLTVDSLWSTQLGYLIKYSSGALHINSYPITVTAHDTAKYDNEADPVFHYSATPLLGSDTWGGALSRVAGDTVGTYSILQGSLTAGANYQITYTGAFLSIFAHPVSIAKDSHDIRSVSLNRYNLLGQRVRFQELQATNGFHIH